MTLCSRHFATPSEPARVPPQWATTGAESGLNDGLRDFSRNSFLSARTNFREKSRKPSFVELALLTFSFEQLKEGRVLACAASARRAMRRANGTGQRLHETFVLGGVISNMTIFIREFSHSVKTMLARGKQCFAAHPANSAAHRRSSVFFVGQEPTKMVLSEESFSA